ncbi:MAG: hypothetical protein Q7S14_00435, partial [bacterium]|nr:hypothetical protein [bacterium]
MKKFFVLFLFILFVFPVTVHAANIVNNPGFETGSLSPWWVWNPSAGSVVVDGSTAHAGSSLKMTLGNGA